MNGYVELIESSRAYEELRRDSDTGLLKHAYVFESVDSDALDALSSLFICLCEKGGKDGAMLKKLSDGGYIDVVRLPSPEKKGKMDVEEITSLTDSAYLQPYELGCKYYIIAASEPLSAPIQNKMLKTLEEPPESARFIIYSSGGDLLPTVKSRCSTVRLEEFPVETVASELEKLGVDASTALTAAAVSRGNIGTAYKIAQDKGYRRAYDYAANFLLNVKRSTQILPSAAEISQDKDKLPAVIDYLELLLRDVIAYRECGADSVVLKSSVSDILTLSREFDTRTMLNLMPLLTRARERLRLYGNPASVVDELLFSILEVKVKCLKS